MKSIQKESFFFIVSTFKKMYFEYNEILNGSPKCKNEYFFTKIKITNTK